MIKVPVSLMLVAINCIISYGFEMMLQPPVDINGTLIKPAAKENEVRGTARTPKPTVKVNENLTYNNSYNATDHIGNQLPNVKSSIIDGKEWWDEILKKRKEEDLQKGNQTEVNKHRKSHKQTTVHLESEEKDSLKNSHYAIIPLNSSTISSIVEESRLNNNPSVTESSSSSPSKICRSFLCSYLVLPISSGIYCYNLYQSVKGWNVFS